MDTRETGEEPDLEGMFGRDQIVPWGGMKVCVIPPTLATVRAACEHLRVDLLFFSATVEKSPTAGLRDLATAFCEQTPAERLVPVLQTVCAPLAQPPGPLAAELEVREWGRLEKMLQEDAGARAELVYASLSMVRDLPRVAASIGVGEFREWLRGTERVDFDAEVARTIPHDLELDRGPFPLELLAQEIASRFSVEDIRDCGGVEEVLRYPFEAVLRLIDLFPELNVRAAAEELHRRLGLPLTPVNLKGPDGPTYTEH